MPLFSINFDLMLQKYAKINGLLCPVITYKFKNIFWLNLPMIGALL